MKWKIIPSEEKRNLLFKTLYSISITIHCLTGTKLENCKRKSFYFHFLFSSFLQSVIIHWISFFDTKKKDKQQYANININTLIQLSNFLASWSSSLFRLSFQVFNFLIFIGINWKTRSVSSTLFFIFFYIFFPGTFENFKFCVWGV